MQEHRQNLSATKAAINSKSPKKLFIKTYGCMMNVYDSEKMAGLIKPLGYVATESMADADLIVINTCHIREKATEKLYSELGRIKKSDRKNARRTMVAVAGCVGQAEGNEIIKRAPNVDIVVGPQSYHHLPELIAKAERKSGGLVDIDFAPEPKFDSISTGHLPLATDHLEFVRTLTIQEGCDKFCTFCVVPYTRGAEFSRPVKDIYEEAERIADSGALEIILLGQNVNAYHGEAEDGTVYNLGKLIELIAGLDGIRHIRYTTSHPLDMHEELYRAHGNIEKLQPYLNLPIQSGSDRILKLMNRRHTRSEYISIIEKVRKHRNDIAVSSDFIVGFPGETDKDFEDTLKLVDETGFASGYSFKYSPRPGTPAAAEEVQVSEHVKEERLQILQQKLLESHEKYNRQFVGRTMEVLFDRRGRQAGQLQGKSPYMQSVYVDSSGQLPVASNPIQQVRITAAYASSLAGEIVNMQKEAA